MAGTKEGGLKAAATNLARDPNHYSNIGKVGGTISRGGGFASNKVGRDGLTGLQRASKAGVLGGTISRRRPTKKVVKPEEDSITVKLEDILPPRKPMFKRLFKRGA